MKTPLTPYDTGAVLEPITWEPLGNPTRFGRVDFDNEEGLTVATVHVSRNEDGTYTLNVFDHEGDLKIKRDDED